MFLQCHVPLYIGGIGRSLQETTKLPFGKKHKTVLTSYSVFRLFYFRLTYSHLPHFRPITYYYFTTITLSSIL